MYDCAERLPRVGGGAAAGLEVAARRVDVERLRRRLESLSW
jgi:hypothetical protein